MSSSSSSSRAPQGHKRALSDSSVEILEIRSVNKKPRTEEERSAPPPPPRREEEQRLHVFQPTPPPRFERIYQRATTERFFVLSRERYDAGDYCPQERFELAGTTGNVYTIRIGRELWCDCPHALKGNQCKHLVYILHRVLKAPYNFLYQFALLSSELRQIFDKLSRPNDDNDDTKNRKAVEGECAICYTDFASDEDKQSSAVVWCRAACGQNLHKTCFDRWARSCSGRVTCPLCRSVWEEVVDGIGDDEDGDAAAAAVDTSLGVEGEEGYINVADQLGISSERDSHMGSHKS
ncbi:hypothetical protein MY11210_000973 [Beauveria gryllotalpidicola]